MTALAYICVVTGALTIASWFMRIVDWIEHPTR